MFLDKGLKRLLKNAGLLGIKIPKNAFFDKTILQLVLVAFAVFAFEFSFEVKSFFFSVSILLKDLLFLLLPFVVFSYVASSLLSIKQGAAQLILIILGSIMASNFLAINFGFCFIKIIGVENISTPTNILTDNLHLYFKIPKLQFISNDGALILAIIFSFTCVYLPKKYVDAVKSLKKASDFFLIKIFLKLIPLFIFGFMLNLKPSLYNLFIAGDSLFIIPTAQWIFLLILILVLNLGKLIPSLEFLRNIFPPVISGFFTMSSAANLSLIKNSLAKNNVDEKFANIVPTSCINVHLIGDCIGVTILIFAVLSNFGKTLPSFWEFEYFCIFYVMAKFAVVAIPGGGIFITAPILEKYLDFNPDMIFVITTLYIFTDCFMTAANVAGNCIMPKIIEKVSSFFSRKKMH